MKSSYNSHYRYQIESLSDLSSESFQRRKNKALHNNKTAFFFEVAGLELEDTEIVSFFKSHLLSNDLVFLKPDKSHLYSELKSHPLLFFLISDESDLRILQNLDKSQKNIHLVLSPVYSKQLKALAKFFLEQKDQIPMTWRFLPYNSELPNSLTLAEINSYDIHFPTLTGLEIFNSHVPKHFELQPEPSKPYSIKWQFKVNNSAPKISVIIPTYNNALFLSNVIWHLCQQEFKKEDYEVIIADDGSQDKSSEIIEELFSNLTEKFNITYIYWPKWHPQRGDQQFFRSGLARNLGTRYSAGEYLLFLDSDMLVPKNFVEIAFQKLKTTDLIQFQRYHIHQELSKKNPSYDSVTIGKDTYIEEKHYWSSLFFAAEWQLLPQYWKFTCTYALGIKKQNFLDIGMFKKYYISYGFEDTDLGYEAHKRNMKFELVKLPLLHLTAYDQMQYKNSYSKRVKLLRVTAELFYLQHVDKEIYRLLGDYYKMQKPFKSFFRDLISR